MGLTVHYSIRTREKSSRCAARLVEQMRELALALPFEAVGGIVHLEGDECHADAWAGRDGFLACLVRQAAIPIRVPWACKRVRHELGTTAICTRSLEAAPLELFAFWLTPGAGCEPARIGLARYPREVAVTYDPFEDVRLLDDRGRLSSRKWRHRLARHGSPRGDSPCDYVESRTLPTRLAGWRWGSFCKTQYASDPKHGGPANFLRCHVSLVALLDRIAALPGTKVILDDEGKFGRHRSRNDGGPGRAPYCWRAGNYDPRALLAEVGHWNELIAAALGALKDSFGSSVAAPIFSCRDFERLEFRGRRSGEVVPFLEALKALDT